MNVTKIIHRHWLPDLQKMLSDSSTAELLVASYTWLTFKAPELGNTVAFLHNSYTNDSRLVKNCMQISNDTHLVLPHPFILYVHWPRHPAKPPTLTWAMADKGVTNCSSNTQHGSKFWKNTCLHQNTRHTGKLLPSGTWIGQSCFSHSTGINGKRL